MADDEEEIANASAPGWIVTFSDLMTLLLCFFVLLVSMSEIKQPSFNKAIQSLSFAFSGGQIFGEPVQNISPITMNPTNQVSRSESDENKTEKEENTSKVEQKITTTLEAEIASGMMEVEKQKDQILLRFPGDVTFASGSEVINPMALPIFRKLGEMLAGQPLKFEVSGYTDDVPISTSRFRSNWELSSARAVSVAHEILEYGKFTDEQMKVAGYGPGFPLVPNDKPEHRSRNRRVEIQIDPDESKFTESIFGQIINVDSVRQIKEEQRLKDEQLINFDSLKLAAMEKRSKKADIEFSGDDLKEMFDKGDTKTAEAKISEKLETVAPEAAKKGITVEQYSSKGINNVNLQNRPTIKPKNFEEFRLQLQIKLDSMNGRR